MHLDLGGSYSERVTAAGSALSAFNIDRVEVFGCRPWAPQREAGGLRKRFKREMTPMNLHPRIRLRRGGRHTVYTSKDTTYILSL